MKSKIFLAGILVVVSAGGWAAVAERKSIADTAHWVLERADAARGGPRAATVQTNFTELGITNAANQIVIAASPDQVGDGAVVWAAATGMTTPKGVLLVSDQGAGEVAVFNTAGIPKYILDGNAGLLAAPGDMAEMFHTPVALTPGSVAVIDPQNPGSVALASQPYDRRVAGVVAGANDYRPGITLRAGEVGAVPLTLTGTVYCLASSVNGAIRAGDLLTTSAVPGHAMRATDAAASRGSILGKALQDLSGDRGLVMVLASLQ